MVKLTTSSKNVTAAMASYGIQLTSVLRDSSSLKMVLMQMMILMMMVMVSPSSASYVPSTCSYCPVKHLQQHYCDSEIVLKGRVKDDMMIKVSDIFKGHELLTASKRGRINIPFDRPGCREAHLRPGVIYLIMGSFHGNVLHIGSCDLVQPWSSLSSTQRQGVEEVYSLFCQQCHINGTFSLIRPHLHLDSFWDNNAADDSASGLWQTDNCFYNPLASRQYMVDDCETLHSVCVPNIDGASCSWLESEKYVACTKRRMKSPCVREFGAFAFLPAWKCPEQCEGITEDCLRDMCKEATKSIVCT